jgi:acetyl esterase/lipase
MRIEDYPLQEPLSDAGQAFADEVMRRGAGVAADDYTYGPDPYQSIALCVPPHPDGTVLAMVHGGGWTSGYKEHLVFMAPAYNAAGIIFASIGYRLAPNHLHPAGLNDVANALGWIYRNIARHGGDPARIFAGGHSAGGHLTALLAVRRDWLEPRGLPKWLIRGCLPVSGVYDFREGSRPSARPRFLGPVGNEDDASPICNIQGVPPPFLMAHGSNDFPHLSRQAELMENALRDAGASVERIVLEGCNHFSACYAAGEQNGPYAARAVAWMKAH